MKLYFSPGACSLASHIMLREVGAEFDLEQVDNKAKKTKSGADFWQINPKGYVPVLELDDGRRITENPAILQYIGDQYPNSGLVPACGSFERYRVQEWLNFVTSEIHKTFSPLVQARHAGGIQDDRAWRTCPSVTPISTSIWPSTSICTARNSASPTSICS